MGIVRRLLWAVLAFVVLVLLSSGLIVAMADRSLAKYANGAALEQSDATGIVLGSSIDPDGYPSWSSRRRVRLAVKLLTIGKVKHLVFSGGKHWFGRPVYAGESMREYAILQGARPEALSAENEASSTLENLRLSVELIEAQGLGKPVIITDALHLPRAQALAWYLDIEVAGYAVADGFAYRRPVAKILNIGRETLAWWHNLARAAIWSGMDALGYAQEERNNVLR